jgi:hypothetical protein
MDKSSEVARLKDQIAKTRDRIQSMQVQGWCELQFKDPPG